MLLLASLLFFIMSFSTWNFKGLLLNLSAPFTLLIRDSACLFPLLKFCRAMQESGVFIPTISPGCLPTPSLCFYMNWGIFMRFLWILSFPPSVLFLGVEVWWWVMKSGVNIFYLFHWRRFEDCGMKLLLLPDCSLLIHF